MDSEQLQKEHIDRIFAEYEAHYDDPWSKRYREEFVYGYMFSGLNLHGSNVLEAMCGSGQTTEYLLSQGGIVTGLDISKEAISSFKKRWPQCNSLCASILDSQLPSNIFDFVIVSGALHHLHPHLNKAMNEIYRVLKPGGYFCFSEPHAGSLPDFFRKFWYRYDSFFAENEAAIDLEGLKSEYSSRFEFISAKYLGNIANLLVFNSLIFRIPLRFKSIYSPLLLRLERIVSNIQGKLLSCFVVCQWRKKS